MPASFEISSGSSKEERFPIQGLPAPASPSPSPSPSLYVFAAVLTSICFVSINNYFCYHEPSAIAKDFQQHFLLDTREFGTLFTIYSAPNVVLVFFSGQLIDQFGLRLSSLLFNGLILLSMMLAAMLPSPSSDTDTDNSNSSSAWSLSSTQVYLLLLLSRLILGLGGESICACVNTMISRWFSSTNHLNTAMALNQASVQLFGSAAAFYILPHLHNIVQSQRISVVVCMISLAANLVYIHYDSKYQDYLIDVNEVKDIQLHVEETKNAKYQHYQSVLDNESMENSFSSYSDIFDAEPIQTNSTGFISRNIEVLKKFPVLFWLLLLHISLVSPILYTFTAFGPMYLQETFPSTSNATDAGNAISLLYMSIVAAPITGMIIDYIGYRSYIQFFASCNIPLLFLLLTYGLIDPQICMVWMGIVYSITESNGMALISLVVPSELTGTAFGLYGCCISFALLLEPASVGYIRELSGSFALSIWVFFGLTLLGTIVASFVIIYDRWNDNIISKSSQH